MGPVAIVYPDATFYRRLKVKDAEAIVEEHILKGNPVQRLLYRTPGAKEPTRCVHDIDLFKKQKKIVLRNNFYIDPTSIEDYIARDGYAALAKALTQMEPGEIIEEVKKSGLRGAAAPILNRYEVGFHRRCQRKSEYVVCNGDESDRALYGRSVWKATPQYSEGMAICGRAIGSEQGYVYVRAEPWPLKDCPTPLMMPAVRLLGKAYLKPALILILKSSWSRRLCMREETGCLLPSRKGGEPRPRPLPGNAGVWGSPPF